MSKKKSKQDPQANIILALLTLLLVWCGWFWMFNRDFVTGFPAVMASTFMTGVWIWMTIKTAS